MAIGHAVLVSSVCLVIGLAVAFVNLGLTFDEVGDDLPEAFAVLFFLDLAAGLVAAIAVGPLRRAGGWNLLFVVLFCWSETSIAACFVATARIGDKRLLRWDIPTVILLALGGAGTSLLTAWTLHEAVHVSRIEIGVSGVFALTALLWGRVRATRNALVDSLRLQADTAEHARAASERERDALEREHQALVARAEAEQRAEIARDMHDSLSHHLSLIAMNAGALGYRQDMGPEQMRQAAGTIRDSAQAANAELREVLTTLRADSAPLPGGQALVDLVDQARSDGQDVRLTWAGDLDPEALARAGTTTVVSLARITRELITNAGKHAPGLRLDLRVTRDGDVLVLLARNPLPPSPPEESVGDGRSPLSTGTGLLGVRERARLLGGTVEVRDPARDDDPHFEVEVHLPWTT
jgi:signal transduction histidine kinase